MSVSRNMQKTCVEQIFTLIFSRDKSRQWVVEVFIELPNFEAVQKLSD
jgi:hypothetical protein